MAHLTWPNCILSIGKQPWSEDVTLQRVMLTAKCSFLFVVCIFEDRPYLVDCTPKDATKYSLRTKPLSEAPLPAAEVKQQTTVAIFSWLGSHILTGTSKGYINLIETESRKRIHSTKITTGLISLLRLSSNGSQLIVNSTDRIIRVIDMPDLSVITPKNAITKHGDTKRVRQASASAEDVPTPAVEAMTVAEEITTQAEEGASPDPTTLAENIMLTITHKFQDLVNKLRWNDCAFSHASSNGSSDYVTASTYMKKDVYIWELRTNSLLRILESKEEPAIIQWHPKKPILATIAVDTGGITIWGVEPQQKWSALAPDFAEVDENVEYVEREDDFDEFPEEEHRKRRLDREDEPVDVLTIEKTKEEEEESFVLPMMYDIEVSDDEEELVRTGVGTMRKKEVNEGKEWEDRDTEMVNGVTQPRSRKRRG